ncbi:hypothetical protein GWI33_014672 [Rhynchophorus ferrugineus]|uniref:Uncharacterized protein n=1 Tax=Rhynchophorus ferrugineus TaxID=354439 RepID=A0A834I5P4_RHYFE|nr:hypothetical protein GWI33_014672 [Rhynchophorus ferrugineus]
MEGCRDFLLDGLNRWEENDLRKLLFKENSQLVCAGPPVFTIQSNITSKSILQSAQLVIILVGLPYAYMDIINPFCKTSN